MARKTLIGSPSRPERPSGGDAPADRSDDVMLDLGSVERRLHARAYHHWASLVGEARFPMIAALEAEAIGDFSANSVLLDFREDRADPAIAYIGQALRDECGMVDAVARVADLPERSLLARLTGHCEQILHDQAPAGFEAEFVNELGRTILYRAILLPYSSDGLMIDFVHGVVSWKERADPLLQATLDSALLQAVDGQHAPPPHDAGRSLWKLAEKPEGGEEAVIATIDLPIDAAPGTPVVIVGHVDALGALAITGMVSDDPRLAERVLRATRR
ncbi:hypothetical protein [Sphingomonas sp. Leaf21]|uniref:hypothetical protein n=1 Tax=Sphingomonas sp. Leaf21 TaxID=2876550 RepID=UPI001E4849CA|nr:hypothetical protein [Sphingomonas sp. Leaf21]